jgi:hypothetical protein
VNPRREPTRALPRLPADSRDARRPGPPRRLLLLGVVVVALAGALGVLLGALGVGAPATPRAEPESLPAAAATPPVTPPVTPPGTPTPATPSPAADAAAALIAALPAEAYRDCQPREIDAAAGQLASVRCAAARPGADELLVTQWREQAAMDADFARYRRYPDGKCSETTGVRSTWNRGVLACYRNANGHAVLMWEYDDRPVQVVAVRTDGRHEPLYDWWLEVAKTPLR